MTEIEAISARVTVLETVLRQLITHMAVRADDPPGWVQTRKTLAMRALTDEQPVNLGLLEAAVAEFFDQAETVASAYAGPAKIVTPSGLAKLGTPRAMVR